MSKKSLHWSWVLVIIIATLPFLSYAAGGDGHHSGLDEKKIKTMIFQAINVTILLGGLIYFTSAGIRGFLESRRKLFIEARDKAQQALKRAEEDRANIQAKLSKIEGTRQDTIARAEAEAVELKKSLIKEAQETAASIRRDAEETCRTELAKAKAEIRNYLIENARQGAQAQLQKGISAEEHKKLNGQFLKSIEAVQS